DTSLAVFSFTRLPLPYFAYGIRQVSLSENQYALVASPEKALFDRVVTTAGVLLRNERSARHYLLDELRIDEMLLRDFDVRKMKIWVQAAQKKQSLSMITKAIERLCVSISVAFLQIL